MLPDRLIPYREHDGNLVPVWLGARDEVWLRELVEEAIACAGTTASEADERVVDASFRLARQHGVSRRVVEAVWHIERRRSTTRIAAPLPPERIRRVLFALAAERSPEEAIATAAAELGVAREAMLTALFADRPGARRLVPSSSPPTTRTLLEQYNRVVAESIVVRTSEIVATVHAHARRVVGTARLLGLMLQAERDDGDATRLVVSGPLALFHETTKYGRALASWLHTVATTPGWRLEGRARVGGRVLGFHLDASAPIPRARALGRATDSRIEAQLARDLRREAPDVRVERESAVLTIGRRLQFPDFSLVFPEGRVLVEVVGFWTPEYLRAKAALAREAREPLVLCVDERRAHGALAPSEVIVPFRKAVDVELLLRACRHVLGPSPLAPPPPTPRRLRHRLRFAPTSRFVQYAARAGAASESWRRDLFEDLTARSRIRGMCLEAHPVYGPQMLVFGERFVVRAGRDRVAGDTLFVNAVWSREEVSSVAARAKEVSVEMELEGGGGASSDRDDVRELFVLLGAEVRAPSSLDVAHGRG